MHRRPGKPFRALRRLALAAAILSISTLPASPASAQPSPSLSSRATLIVVADAPASRAAIAGLGAKLPSPWQPADDAALRKALTAAGQRTSAGVALGTPAGRASLARKARSAASDAGAQAVLFVRVAPKRGSNLVTLLLVAPGEPDPVLDTAVEVPASDDGAALLSTLSPALARLARPVPADSASPSRANAPPALSSSSSPTPPSDAADAPEPVKIPLGGADRAILVFSAGGGSGARIFNYHDGLTPELRNYSLPAAPNLALAAEVYPFARLSVPVLRGLGVTGGFQHAVGVSSQTSTGMTVSTTWLRAEGGLRLRLPFGEDARFVLGLHGGVVMERFGFTADPKLVAFLPDVNYLFWRAGADGRLRAGPVGLLAGAAYLPAIAGGVLADRFRDTSFAAVELGGGLAVPVVRIFEVRATVTYTRVFYAYHPVPGDVYVAGGALDHLVRAHVFATLLL